MALCEKGCGRYAAEGYPTCCGRCTGNPNASTHGQICNAAHKEMKGAHVRGKLS